VSPTVVVDASIGLALLHIEEHTTAVVGAWTGWISKGVERVVPGHFWIELVNALGRRHGYPAIAIAGALKQLDDLEIRTMEVDRALLLRAASLVEAHGLSAYDAIYLALAEALDADLATLDRRLAAAAGDRGRFVGWSQGPAPHRTAEEPAPFEIRERPRTVGSADLAAFGAYLAELRYQFERQAQARGSAAPRVRAEPHARVIDDEAVGVHAEVGSERP